MAGRGALAAAEEGGEKERELMIPLSDHTKMPVQVESKKTDYEISKETECGFGFFRGSFLQRLATQNVFAFVYGMLGCAFFATYSYSNGAITTIEKRFKIPSTTIGLIGMGNDITQVFSAMVLSYYAGKGHRPRWIGVGAFASFMFCLMTTLPHFIFGPGEDALRLTAEYAHQMNTTSDLLDEESQKKLCLPGTEGAHCEKSDINVVAVIIFVIANYMSGIGNTLFYSIGTTYMDDNVQREQSPALLSFSFFLRTLGVAVGFALASLCLRSYISPTLTPTIDRHDPRWMGAWWVGWLVLAITFLTLGFSLSLFPNVLPKEAARRAAALERAQSQNLNGVVKKEEEPEEHASLSDMIATLKRLVKNPTLMSVNMAYIFLCFGYMPYWVYMPKYIETQYRHSASVSSLITGAASLLFSAVGILLSGIVISRYKPTARQMALWNMIIAISTVIGVISYSFLGCENDSYHGLIADQEFKTSFPCNTQCSCEYVPYSPVCSPSGKTFISACHAGCSSSVRGKTDVEMYTNCSCIPPNNADPELLSNWTLSSPGWENGGDAKPGECPKDCTTIFVLFMCVMCFLEFMAASGKITDLFVSVRCVDGKDKAVAIGLGTTMICIFSFVPAPTFFGYLMDRTCLVWATTCDGTGNCWLYNDSAMRKIVNRTAAGFMTVSVLFYAAVWYLVKDLQIFDDDTEEKKDSKKQP